MRRWFERLSVHRKLVVLAIVIASAAVLVAVAGLIVMDVVRVRADAETETADLAQVLAENVAAAVVLGARPAAHDTLSSVRLRRTVRRACIYLPNGRLYTGVHVPPGDSCPPQFTVSDASPWLAQRGTVWSTQPIHFDGRVVGDVLVERSLGNMRARIVVTVAVGAGMLVLVSSLVLPLAHRLLRTISGPIGALAHAARDIGLDDAYVMPSIAAPPDEVGELVRTFSDMVRRVSHSSATLTEANEALRREVDERRRVEGEREELLERERRASQLKDEFLATVSHELRTPLNAILGWAQILRRGEVTPAVLARAVASIDRNARAQTRLVEDLIDVSRVVSGKLRLEVRLIDLRAVVEDAADVVRPVGDVKGVTVALALVPGPCLVLGDADRLQQALWHLLSNAVKFTPTGGAVRISLAEADAEWVVRVHDTGMGIADSFVPHLFERFRQADQSMTRAHGGLGVGLAIARELTQLHGGTVTGASDGPGLGAEFTMRLPRYAGPETMPAPRLVAPAAVPSLDGVRVLVVDDNGDTLDVARTTLAAAGAAVEVVDSAVHALERWQRRHRDVLVCDLAMPQMDGYELLARVRAIDATQGRFTPAIAVSAHASEAHQVRSIRAGFQRHVAKPWGATDLVRAVAHAVDRA